MLVRRCVAVGRRGFCSSVPAKLDFEWLQSEKARAGGGKTCVVLHGMLGNKKNLRRISNIVVDNFPEYRLMLVTLRAHGNSERGLPPHTVQACSHDVACLLDDEKIGTPDVVIGHSFGGKVSGGCVGGLQVDKLCTNEFILTKYSITQGRARAVYACKPSPRHGTTPNVGP